MISNIICHAFRHARVANCMHKYVLNCMFPAHHKLQISTSKSSHLDISNLKHKIPNITKHRDKATSQQTNIATHAHTLHTHTRSRCIAVCAIDCLRRLIRRNSAKYLTAPKYHDIIIILSNYVYIQKYETQDRSDAISRNSTFKRT